MPTPQAAAMLPSASLVIGQTPAAASGWGQPPPATAAAAALQQQQSNMAQQLQKQQQQQHQYNKSAAAAVNQMKAMSGSQQFQVCMCIKFPDLVQLIHFVCCGDNHCLDDIYRYANLVVARFVNFKFVVSRVFLFICCTQLFSTGSA